LRGITCNAIIENRDVRVFRHFGFTSKDIRGALESLCNLDVLKPVGFATVLNDVIYKIDKSLFDFMFDLHLLNSHDIFDKIESVMKDIWSRFRPPTEDEKSWLYFVYGNKEADQLINDAHESRNKITNREINKKVVEINAEITRIVDYMKWVQESYKTTIDKHDTLLRNIYEIIYPGFFGKIQLNI
jgi:hypothetical protein